MCVIAQNRVNTHKIEMFVTTVVFVHQKAETMWSLFFTFACKIRKLRKKMEDKKKGKVFVIDDNDDILFALNLPPYCQTRFPCVPFLC